MGDEDKVDEIAPVGSGDDEDDTETDENEDTDDSNSVVEEDKSE